MGRGRGAAEHSQRRLCTGRRRGPEEPGRPELQNGMRARVCHGRGSGSERCGALQSRPTVTDRRVGPPGPAVSAGTHVSGKTAAGVWACAAGRLDTCVDPCAGTRGPAPPRRLPLGDGT